MKIKFLILLLSLLLIISVIYNIKPDNNLWFINFSNANTRDTYDSFHNINEAQKLATGKGVKVGIIGKYFGYKKNRKIYSGGKNFTENDEAFLDIAEHGFWMATTLKEISPDVEIFALNARNRDKEKETTAIIDAINWAIENDIDILTYSAEAFKKKHKDEIDKAVKMATEKDIITTFIHYDLNENILPLGFFPNSPKSYRRAADVNIFHFDYNLMLLFSYENYIKSNRNMGANIGGHPYFSNSSMSPVLAGIIAMMREVDNSLTAIEYKEILVNTSYKIEYEGYKVNNVVNAVKAINYLKKKKKRE